MIKKLLIPVFILFLSDIAFANMWTQKADFGGTARYQAVGFSIGTKGYIGTGNDGADKKDFWEWDQGTNVWTQKADFGGTARSGAVGFSIGTKGYIGTGSGYLQDFWEWNQATNAWTQKANFGGIGRTGATGFSIGTKGYIGTGYYYSGGSNIYKSDFWEWNQATNTWTQKASLTYNPRGLAVGFSIGSKGYIGLGKTGVSTYTQDFEEYDPSTNTWTVKAYFGNYQTDVRAGSVGFSIGNYGYVGTGNYNNTKKKDFWRWDPAFNVWTQLDDFEGIARTTGVGFSIGNKGYFGTGNMTASPNYTKDFWEFDPSGCSVNPITAAFTPYHRWDHAYPFDVIGATNYLLFQNNSTSIHSIAPITYYWQVDGITFDTTYDWELGINVYNWSGNYTFNDTGTHIISLIADFNCQRDTAYDTITVICPGVWVQRANVGSQTRCSAVGFVIGNKGYIGTGARGSTNLRDFWEWDKSTNVWTQKADYGGSGRWGASGFSVNNKGYIVGGETYNWISGITTYFKSVWEYNPLSNSWNQKTDIPISVGRANGTAFSIADKGYFGAGLGGSSGAAYHDLWEYDPINDSWTEKLNSGIYGSYNANFILNDKAYIVSGNQLYEYNPILNVITPKTSCPNTNANPAAFSIGNYGYVMEDGFGGDNGGKLWRYEPNLDTWVEIATAPQGITSTDYDPIGFSIGNNGYYGAGGNHDAERNDFWEYYPDSCDAGMVTQVKPVEQNKTEVQVYPNPFTTQTTVSLTNDVKNAVLKLYDLSGREVKRVNFTGKQVIIEREGLQSGVYIYSVNTNTQVIATGKLVIE